MDTDYTSFGSKVSYSIKFYSNTMPYKKLEGQFKFYITTQFTTNPNSILHICSCSQCFHNLQKNLYVFAPLYFLKKFKYIVVFEFIQEVLGVMFTFYMYSDNILYHLPCYKHIKYYIYKICLQFIAI